MLRVLLNLAEGSCSWSLTYVCEKRKTNSKISVLLPSSYSFYWHLIFRDFNCFCSLRAWSWFVKLKKCLLLWSVITVLCSSLFLPKLVFLLKLAQVQTSVAESGCQQCINIRNLWQHFSFILCFCGCSSDSPLAVEMLASSILALYCCMVLPWKADGMVSFTSRGLLEIWFRAFTLGGYLGCLQARVMTGSLSPVLWEQVSILGLIRLISWSCKFQQSGLSIPCGKGHMWR